MAEFIPGECAGLGISTSRRQSTSRWQWERSRQLEKPRCGRFVSPGEAAIERAFHVGRDNGNPFKRRFNVVPSFTLPFIRLAPDAGELEFVTGRRGLVPHWYGRIDFHVISSATPDTESKRHLLRYHRSIENKREAA